MKYETYLLLLLGLAGYVAYREIYQSRGNMAGLGFAWSDPAHVFHKTKRYKRKGSQGAVSIADTLTQELEAPLTAGASQSSEAVNGLGFYPLLY